MKKSEMLHLTEIAVINSPSISPESKLKILNMLFDEEHIALFMENREAEKVAENEGV